MRIWKIKLERLYGRPPQINTSNDFGTALSRSEAAASRTTEHVKRTNLIHFKAFKLIF